MEKTVKKQRFYGIAKGFISFFMLFSAYFSFSHAEDFSRLGFPAYFRIELSIAKVIGALLLLVPALPGRVREWIYAGFIITMVSALIAHICSGDPAGNIIFVAVDLLLVLACMYYVSKANKLVIQ